MFHSATYIFVFWFIAHETSRKYIITKGILQKCETNIKKGNQTSYGKMKQIIKSSGSAKIVFIVDNDIN